LLGAVAMRMDLSEAIKMVVDGTLDAQENPLANTVTYGVHKFHKYHTLSSHFYISRPIFFHRTSFDSWPVDIQQAMQKAVTEAVAAQRDMAIEEHKQSLRAILDAGCEVAELSAPEHKAFADAVAPLLDDAKKMYPAEMFKMVPKS
jgi:TRAP-type C4-dicarboxylate transport system substrate-binding protein